MVIQNSVLTEMSRVTKQDGYLVFISTWKMEKKILSNIKEMINEYNDLELYDYIEKHRYEALIIKKCLNNNINKKFI